MLDLDDYRGGKLPAELALAVKSTYRARGQDLPPMLLFGDVHDVDTGARACLRHYSCHLSAETIAKALPGSYRAESAGRL